MWDGVLRQLEQQRTSGGAVIGAVAAMLLEGLRLLRNEANRFDGRLDGMLQRLQRIEKSTQSVLMAGDVEYKCTPAVQVGDPVGVVADDRVDRADGALPLLAIGFCASKSTESRCVVRKQGPVRLGGCVAGRLYFLGAGPGAVTDAEPFTVGALKVRQTLGMGQNSNTLDANVTLEFVRLRT